jgi:hypothetical protein
MRNELLTGSEQSEKCASLRKKFHTRFLKEAPMSSIADGAMSIQTSSESVPAPPAWFGEVTLSVGYLRKHDVLTKISEGVRFARRRFGRYEVIDFVAVQIALRHQRRTDPGSLLPEPAALCRSVHGLVWA